MKPLAVGIFWLCMAGEGLSQSPATQATFEVASVKPSPMDAQGMFVRYLPDGGLRITGATLKNLISIAFDVRQFQISGGPAWMETERFDVEARAVTADDDTATDPKKVSAAQRKTGERLRSLLADRFQLRIHAENKEQAVYALVVAKGGSKLQESTDGNMIRKIGRGELKGQGVALRMLVLNLSSELDRRVVDKTGLTAHYSFDLKWTNNPATSATAEPDLPSIFTALQEQLGLRLESEKGTVEILVVDGAERPSKN